MSGFAPVDKRDIRSQLHPDRDRERLVNQADRTDAHIDELGGPINITISVRLADAAKEGNIQALTVAYGTKEKQCVAKLAIPINPETDIKALLDTKIYTETVSIYPKSHSWSASQWIKAATISSYGNQIPLNVTQPYRLTEVLTGSLHFGENWELLADVKFHERFDFPNNDPVKIDTISMDVFCSVNPHIPKASNNLFFATTNVALYATRSESFILSGFHNTE
ncbi:unnamed protein product [Echinostoma caproni]|uniref:Uncharacterized protein n=1 Tax=Echinostoma caproni TaxID=27848 RepID=A0A3P8J4P8_9TREM|nr:unnamed protein product [Echinostoma caproni]